MNYSKSTGCFYPADISYSSLPADLITVTDQDYARAMSRAPGETLDVAGGKLVILPAPIVSQAERLARAQTAALVSIDQIHATTVQHLVGNPTEIEKDTWPLKLETAQALVGGITLSAASEAFLTALGLTTQDARQTWARSVQTKATAYATVVGRVDRLRDVARTASRAASSEAQASAALDALRAGVNALTGAAA